jgi:anti-sigma B factor antagonist
MDGRPQFHVELLPPSAGYTVVELEGELDIYTAPRFEEALRHSMEAGARHLLVDLTRVNFIDSTALSVVVDAVKRLHAVRGSLDVICRDANLRRTFEITGLTRILAIYASREEALAGTVAG